MFAFTKQEQKLLLLIVIAFITGLAIKYYRQRGAEECTDVSWETEREKILSEFREAATPVHKKTPSSEHAMPGSVSKDAITGRININTASFEELQILPRIGPATAKKIIEYRKAKGPFKNTADIIKVKSIGPKTFEKIEKYITID